MKFDLIISNPPYNRNLDLKILKDVYELSDKICFVHPARWLYSQKESTHITYKIKNLLEKSYCYFYLDSAYKFFTDVQINEGICISYINKNEAIKYIIDDVYESNSSYRANSLYDISKYGPNPLYESIKYKVLKYCKEKNNLLNMQDMFSEYEHIVSFSGIQNYTCMIAKYPGKQEYPIKFYFNDVEQKNNFTKYIKTKIARFCVTIYKMGRNLDSGELASVPYMPTYTRPWTDDDVAKELGLTDEELAWAINWIPDYYPEDKEKYAKRI